MGAEQWKTGLVQVTSASQVVIGSASCDWLSQIAAGHVFKINEDGEATYTIATVLTATRLLLSANYSGTGGTGLPYIACRSFTTNRGYWRPLQGDSDWAEIFSQETVDKIDTDIQALINLCATLGYSASAMINANASIVNLQTNMINANASIVNLQTNMINANASIAALIYDPQLKTANYQIVSGDNFILGSGDITITLASASDKQEVKFANRSLDTNASILISKSGGDTIEGSPTVKLRYKYGTVTLVGDGANTHISF